MFPFGAVCPYADCEISCGEPPVITNGRVDSASSNASVALYTCESGHILSGSGRIACNGSSGHWSLQPVCVQDPGTCTTLCTACVASFDQ